MPSDRRPKPRESPNPQRSTGSLRRPVLPEHVHVFESNSDVTFAVDRDMLVEIWRVKPTSELFARLDGYFRWLIERQSPIVVLSVIESLETPDAAAQNDLAVVVFHGFTTGVR